MRRRPRCSLQPRACCPARVGERARGCHASQPLTATHTACTPSAHCHPALLLMCTPRGPAAAPTTLRTLLPRALLLTPAQPPQFPLFAPRNTPQLLLSTAARTTIRCSPFRRPRLLPYTTSPPIGPKGPKIALLSPCRLPSLSLHHPPSLHHVHAAPVAWLAPLAAPTAAAPRPPALPPPRGRSAPAPHPRLGAGRW